MHRRQFMMVLGAGGAAIALTAALSACDEMPVSATAPWNGPRPDEADPRLRALSWAMLAPNPHNLQSWVADIREPDLIKLHVDLKRLLPHTDPPNRQILIGCGAFLELLRIAASHDGWRAEIELFPEGEYGSDAVDARPFALVRMVRDPGLAPDALFSAVKTRRTNRSPYEAKVPDAKTLNALASAATQPNVRLIATNDAEKVARIRDLAIAGYRVEFTNQATWNESADAIRLGAQAVAAEPSGIAALGTDVWWGRTLGLLSPSSLRNTDGMAAHRAIKDSIDAANHTHAWIWLVSADNSRRSQLETGRAYLRTDLTAAALGLAIQPNSQVLQEFVEMRELYQAFHREVEITAPSRVQMLARVGYATRPGPAPRRQVTSVVRA
jgi:hypothetical protein